MQAAWASDRRRVTGWEAKGGHASRTRPRSGDPESGITAVTVGCFIFAVAYLSSPDPETGRKLSLIALGAIAVGLLTGWLPRARPSRVARPLLLGLGLLSAASALALLGTPSLERTLDEVARVVGFAALVVFGLLALRRRRWKAAASGITLGATAVCGLAVLARVFPDLVSVDFTTLADGRLAYPLGYWNALAAWGAMTIAMLLAWAADGRDRSVRSRAAAALPLALTCLYFTYSRGGILTALLGVTVVVLATRHRRRALIQLGVSIAGMAVVVLVVRAHPEIAHGTGAYGGPAVGGVLVLVSVAAWVAARQLRLERREEGGMRRRRPGRLLARRRAVAGVLAALLVLILIPTVYALVGESEPIAGTGEADPAARLVSQDGNRPLYWESALQAGWENPVQGIGPGTFEFWWAQDARADELVRDAHSLYLEQFAELGFLGLFGAALTAGGALWLALTPLRLGERGPAAVAMPAAAAVFVSYLAIDWVWEVNAVMVFGLGCAVVAGAAASTSVRGSAPAVPSEPRRRQRGRAMSPAITSGLVLLAIVGAALQVPGLVSAERLEASNEALVVGLEGRAVELATEASDAAPWAAAPYAQLAFIHWTAERYSRARAAALDGAEREPDGFRLWLLLARIELELGDATAARAAFDRAAELAPRAGGVVGDSGSQLRTRIEEAEG